MNQFRPQCFITALLTTLLLAKPAAGSANDQFVYVDLQMISMIMLTKSWGSDGENLVEDRLVRFLTSAEKLKPWTFIHAKENKQYTLRFVARKTDEHIRQIKLHVELVINGIALKPIHLSPAKTFSELKDLFQNKTPENFSEWLINRVSSTEPARQNDRGPLSKIESILRKNVPIAKNAHWDYFHDRAHIYLPLTRNRQLGQEHFKVYCLRKQTIHRTPSQPRSYSMMTRFYAHGLGAWEPSDPEAPEHHLVTKPSKLVVGRYDIQDPDDKSNSELMEHTPQIVHLCSFDEDEGKSKRRGIRQYENEDKDMHGNWLCAFTRKQDRLYTIDYRGKQQ